MSDVWDLVRAERAALVDDLSGLTDEQWEAPSLCGGWTVHDVAAHLVDNARTTRVGIVVAMVRARFDFDRQNDQGVARVKGATPAETLQRLREVVGRTSTPPAPLDSRLVEEVAHGEDVRRPLGLTRAYPEESVVRALAHQLRTSVGLGGGKQRAAGLRLVASDDDWSHGEGPEVRGPLVSLLLAVSGREQALADLTGPGVARLGSALSG
ncbi:maleylpyruvate isomerase family mycothiol-dependent enzyme [Nocardioides sp. zg-1228]|uniref:maleylpyruvate isomerase family mycothiol-dependent enzyme n=1 Tax=Nocardioides sp. zg-1228 TaxID=2763008 RepID=UPI00164362B3|nr:maleylpyruvate isomerase family mycothiol-dependent enzyme [Nocardioides sp. zg-1228]MBC2931822.1 maleylpyruvate isomerase family mycothiol-dependent enzyme [Nocardioides sp. zg-1228]QSF57394.1 maleylpyruvate isomerase family mycothiol-dependent enzyme [Nocardioides sp. zg-1228]